jgi:hypothetical protein
MKIKKDKSLLAIACLGLLFSLSICPKIHADPAIRKTWLSTLKTYKGHTWASGVHLCFDDARNKYGHFKDLPAHRKNYSPLDDRYNDNTWWTSYPDLLNRLNGRVTFEVYDKEHHTGMGFIDIKYTSAGQYGATLYVHLMEPYECEYYVGPPGGIQGNISIDICIYKKGEEQNSVEEL